MASILQRESSFCDKDQNDTIVRALYEQKQSYTFCDVVMKVCGRDIYAHSNILAAASPYFSQFLAQDLPRTFSQRTPQVIEIQIDGSEPNMVYEEAVAAVIDFIYTGRMTVKDDNAAQIIEIARIMQMDNIVKFCEDFIAGKTPLGTIVLDGQTRHYRDGSVNTDKSFDVNQRVQLVDFITSIPEPTIIQHTSKVKPSKMLSIATQVMPQLLGLRPEVSSTRDISTSTDRRLFEQLGSTVWKGPGRKPNYLKNLQVADSKKLSDQKAVEKSIDREKSAKSADHGGGDIVDSFPEDAAPIDQAETSDTLSPQADDKAEENKTPEKAPSTRYQKLFTELTAEPELRKSTLKRNAKVLHEQESSKTNEEPDGKTSDNTTPEKEAKSTSPKKTTPKPKQFHQLVGLTTRSGKKLIKQEIAASPRVGAGSIQEAEEDAQDDGEVSLHAAVLMRPITKTEIEEGEIDYSADRDDDDNGENDHSGDGLESGEIPVPEKSERRSGRKRGRPRKDEQFEVYFGVDTTATKKYSCSTCDFTTNKVREMSSHNKLHKLEQNTCFYCEQKFDDHEVLTQHMDRHKGPNPFFCNVCDSRFKTRTQLNLHLPKHSEDKPFICEICSQGFKWKHALKSHMITHSNKKDHLCDICGYATAHKSQLKAHHLIHTGQTYKCDFPHCPFQATKLQNMKYHTLTHTREKPHQCEVCGQSFSLVKNMRRHMLLHSADKSYKCTTCDFASTRYDKLKEHQLKLHGYGTPPEKRVRISDMVEANLSQITLEGRQYLEPVMLAPKTEVDTDPTITILNPPTVEIPMPRDITLNPCEDHQSVQLLRNQTIIITQGDVTEELSGATAVAEGGVIQTHGIPLVEGTLVQGGENDEQYPVHYTEVMIPASQVDVGSLVQTVYVTASGEMAVDDQSPNPTHSVL